MRFYAQVLNAPRSLEIVETEHCPACERARLLDLNQGDYVVIEYWPADVTDPTPTHVRRWVSLFIDNNDVAVFYCEGV